jgi:DNA polymerase-3 subunit beta
MRLKISDAAAFTDAVAWVAKHINPRTHIPVLNTVRLTATEAGFSISAYDYDTSATVHPIPGVIVAEPGGAAVGGVMLAQLAATVRPDRVEVDGGTGLRLTSRRSNARLPLAKTADLPALPDPPKATLAVAGHELARSITQLAPMCCDPTIKVEVSGIHLHMAGRGLLALEATDRYRMARHLIEVDGDLGVDEVTVPPAPLLAAVRGWSDAPATIGTTGSIVALAQGPRTTTVSTIASGFPSFDQILDADTPLSMQVDGDQLRAALKAAATAARVVDLDMGEVLTVRAANDEKGERLADWETALDYQPDLSGVEDCKRVNAGFLASCIEAVDGPEVTFGFYGPGGRRLLQVNRGQQRTAALMAIRKD